MVALRIELADVAGIIPDQHGKFMLPSLPEDLQVTLSGQDQLGDPTGPINGSGEIPLIFKEHAGEAVWILHQTLRQWAADLGHAHRGDSPVTLARWFLDRLDLVAKHPDAAALVDEVTDAIHQARRAIDRPNDDRIYLGPCGATIHGQRGRFMQPRLCREELYAYPWIDVITCPNPDCLTMYRVTDRQEWLRERAHQYQGTASEVAGFLRLTGVACTTEQIRGYARSRNGRPPRLEPAGTNPRGYPTYLISDVLDAIKDRYVRRV